MTSSATPRVMSVARCRHGSGRGRQEGGAGSERSRTNCTWSSRGGRLPSGDGTTRPSRRLPGSGSRKPRSRHSRVKPSLTASACDASLPGIREQLEALEAELAEGPVEDEARRSEGDAPAARVPRDPVADLGRLPRGEEVEADAPEQLARARVGDGQPGALAGHQTAPRVGDEPLGVGERCTAPAGRRSSGRRPGRRRRPGRPGHRPARRAGRPAGRRSSRGQPRSPGRGSPGCGPRVPGQHGVQDVDRVCRSRAGQVRARRPRD